MDDLGGTPSIAPGTIERSSLDTPKPASDRGFHLLEDFWPKSLSRVALLDGTRTQARKRSGLKNKKNDPGERSRYKYANPNAFEQGKAGKRVVQVGRWWVSG